ncbi:MAG TPA: L,D-transpeptidase family protein [Cyclobacteriaceae bacterium]|nr:L,D-transpeptidase family protein [Cyclobacteriaceae bacterium]
MIKWFTRILLLSIVSALLLYYYIPEKELSPTTKIDKLVVIKSKHKMEAYANGKIIKIYTVSLGQHDGDKESEGDKKTPLGEYIINAKNPNSGYHKNLGLSYPNADDISKAKLKGVRPGGEIKIHGIKNGIGFIGRFHRLYNWTAGCIAVTDKEVDELYSAVAIGTPIIIKP